MPEWEIDLPESRGTSEGGALEGDALDAGLFDEPFDCIRGDFEFVAPGPTNRYSYMRELKRF